MTVAVLPVSMIRVDYLSECDKDYAAGLKAAQTFDGLQRFVEQWKSLAHDAWESAMAANFDWDEFAAGRKMENASSPVSCG